jgi:hypothetical protein
LAAPLRSALLIWTCLGLSYCQSSDKTPHDLSTANRPPPENADYDHFAEFAVNPAGKYVALAKSLLTKQEFTVTGMTQKEATDLALEQCNTVSGINAACVPMRVYTTRLAPLITGETMKRWFCFAREQDYGPELQTSRTWIGGGEKIQVTQKEALNQCRTGAGNLCQILKCFNGQQEKPY